MKKIRFLLFFVVLLTLGGVFPSPAVALLHAQTTYTYFALGPGGADVIPHQIVRANNDRIYIFTNQEGTGVVRAYRTINAGLPADASAFAAPVQLIETSNPISLDAVYDGGSYIHVFMNLLNGSVKDYPFDITTNTFRSPTLLASNGGSVSSVLYGGTSGAAGMQDTSGNLHVVYWTNGNHILHRAYSYNGSTNTLTALGAFTQVDTAGSANHPALAVSPVDNSLTVAWVSEADNPARIRTRTRSSSGVWSSVQSASTAPVWTSTDNGLNIDQGPSLIVDTGGVKHITYIQAFDPASGDYGRVHYLRDSGSGWVDQALSIFTHDPALALNSSGEFYIIGHGHPKNSSCRSEDDMCFTKRNSNGTWGTPQLFAARPSVSNSFDTSPSVKWSVVGFNRPETIEFLFASTPYNDPTIYYARLPEGSGMSSPVISGNVGTAGVTLTYTDGTPKTITSNASGYYSFPVSTGWSGTVTPSKAGYWFTPVNRSYSNVTTSQVMQDYTGSNAWAGGVVIQSDRNVVAVGRPHIGEEVTTYNGFQTGSLTSYLPMLFKDAFGGSYDSAFYVQNLDPAQSAGVTIDFYDSSGSLTCTLPDTLAPLASRGYWVPGQACLPAGWIGGAVVTSNRSIVTVGRPHVGTQVMTYNGVNEGSLAAYMPMLFKNAFGGSYDSAFYVQNVDGAHTASITVKYYDSSGALTCSKPAETIAPRASRGYWVPDESCLPSQWVGSGVITSDYPIVTIARPHVGAEISTYNGLPSGSLTSHLPMLFKDAFGGSYDAAFYMQNVDATQTAQVTIKYYDSAGNLSCTHSPETIPPLSSKAYWVPGEACLPAGWVGGAVMTSDFPIVTAGRPHIGAQVTSYAGSTGSATGVTLPMLFKNIWGSYNSAFYIQNTDPSGPAAITVRFYDMNGNLNCQRSDSIPPLATLGYWLPSVTCMP